MLVDSLTDIFLWRDVFDRRLLERTWLISGLWLGHGDMCCWCCITTFLRKLRWWERRSVFFFSSIENSKQISWKWWCLQTLFGLFLKLCIKKNIFHHSLHSGLKFKFRFWHISAGVFHCVRPWGQLWPDVPLLPYFLHRCFANWAPAVSPRRSVLTLTHLSSDKSST